MRRTTSMPFLRSHSLVLLLAPLVWAGCSLNDIVDAKPPATTLGREITRTEAGAQALLRSAMTQFASVLNGNNPSLPGSTYIVASGVFTDEFLSFSPTLNSEFDLRVTTGSLGYRNSLDVLYANLQYARVTAQLARQAVGTYGTRLDPFFRGIAMVTEAYTIIHLAELFCSGIPLSDASLDGDVHYRAGLPTDSLFARAIILLDSALALHTDSTRLFDLARVAKGRALLSLGQYPEAAEAAAGVSPGFVYSVEHHAQVVGLANGLGGSVAPLVHIQDREGTNGINWISSNDPRMKIGSLFGRYYKPDLYTTATSPTILATAIEAKLIEAEGALERGDTSSWLGILNEIRTNGNTLPPNASCPVGVTLPCPAAGSGGVAGLPKLSDPGTPKARIDLLFRERAFWLYATGHRQGDLRRLVRVYGRSQADVYPGGVYSNPGVSVSNGALYGDVVALPITGAELSTNPVYTGCLTLTR